MQKSPSPASWRRGAERSNGRNRKPPAANAGGLFFPQSKSLGLDRGGYSAGVLAKIVYAGTNNPSFQQGSQDLAELADLQVSAKQVERISERIGDERCAERDLEVAAYLALPLAERKSAPAGVTAPTLAVVQVDGGRLQIRDPAAESPDDAESDSDNPTKGKHWREDKIGLLMTMASEAAASDPCPEIPESFVDPTRILKLARELKKQPAGTADAVKEAADPDSAEEETAPPENAWKPPEVESKQFVATRRPWSAFGPMVATAAWQRGFFAAERRTFLGDGADNNWTLWRQHFSSFVPILDFIHGLSYVFAAATAGRPFPEGWPCYVSWITWVWQGQVEKVIAALAERQAELGAPDANESESSPRHIVARALSYLQNNKDRMRYDQYRTQGLPITTSYVESAVKQFNQRVKGTEKFWTETGVEAILELRGDYLSDGDLPAAFWQRRQAAESGQRRYRRAA